ncbi:MAG: pimeloyl-ACP methyl ester carboxylesterase [Saprospiraceae bacterium]|jgi:pimeloyl-ACP methyl ester carboxylesterase
MKNYLFVVFFILIASCAEESLFGEETSLHFWLKHKGADMPVVIEGNTNSKIFILLLHGGPGGSAQKFNNNLTPFSDILEEDYAMVYWDQRNAGISRGEWDSSKITLAQHTEDLDQVIELLKFKFGDEIIMFLAGHSWGGYLSQAYLLEPNQQNKIRGWISIDGLCNRNQNIRDALQRIPEIANEQIALDNAKEEWSDILEFTLIEAAKNIQNYDKNLESNVFSLIRSSEEIIAETNLLEYKAGSNFKATFKNNLHPFIFSVNNRTLNLLIPQIYDFDIFIADNLVNINIPSLFIYGKYDVRTPYFQAEYAMERISTDPTDKQLIIFPFSDHSSPANEPVGIAEEIKLFVEKYK